MCFFNIPLTLKIPIPYRTLDITQRFSNFNFGFMDIVPTHTALLVSKKKNSLFIHLFPIILCLQPYDVGSENETTSRLVSS